MLLTALLCVWGDRFLKYIFTHIIFNVVIKKKIQLNKIRKTNTKTYFSIIFNIRYFAIPGGKFGHWSCFKIYVINTICLVIVISKHNSSLKCFLLKFILQLKSNILHTNDLLFETNMQI